MNNSIFQQEKNLISTLLCCNSIIHKNINLSNNTDTKSFNNSFVKLYESIVDDKFDDSNINEFNKINFTDFHGNLYAYFLSVIDYINNENNNLNNNIIVPLNESIIDTSFNIDSFKDSLKSIINNLSTINEFDKLDSLPETIRKIKLFTGKSIIVFGFEVGPAIINNISFQNELSTRFNKSSNELISIIYDKSNKQVLFVFHGTIISYIIESNELNYYNDIWNEKDSVLIIKDIHTITSDNYYQFLSDNLNKNFVEIYKNINNESMSSKFKFTDNLFGDIRRQQELVQKNQTNRWFIKD